MELFHQMGGGRLIGYVNSDCRLEDLVQAEMNTLGPDSELKRSDIEEKIVQIEDTQYYDFSGLSQQTLDESQWYRLNPSYVYNIAARWWFEEQP